MKILVLLFVISGLLSTCATTKKENQSDVQGNQKDYFRVAFYNVENLYDTKNDPSVDDEEFLPTSELQWTIERYQKKVNDIAHVLYSIDSIRLPGLIGLVEIENQQVLEDLAKTGYLSKGNYQIVHYDSPDARGIDVALLCQPSFFKVLESKKIPITIAKEPDFKTRDILFVKGLTSLKDTLFVFVNHWSSRREGQDQSEYRRVAAAELLRAAVDSLLALNRSAKIIIMGDMNDEPTDKSLNITLKATNNRQPATKDELYNLMYDKKLNKEGTLSYKGAWNMLDNLIVSQGLLTAKKGCTVTFESSEIFKPLWIQYRNPKTDEYTPNKTYGGKNYFGGYSDHFPVFFHVYKK